MQITKKNENNKEESMAVFSCPEVQAWVKAIGSSINCANGKMCTCSTCARGGKQAELYEKPKYQSQSEAAAICLKYIDPEVGSKCDSDFE